MKISVVIPIYNAENYIENTLNNYLRQSCDDVEFLLIDDGSNDSSYEICDIIAKLHSNVTIIHKENGGVSSARNLGIDMATGDYIVFLDADDYIDKDFFSVMLNLALEKELDVVSCGIAMELEKKNGMVLKQSEMLYSDEDVILESSQEIKECMLNLWEKSVPYNVVNKLYRRKLLLDTQIKFTQLTMGEDLEFNLLVFSKCKRMGLTSRTVYHYIREREGSATSKYIPEWFEIRKNEHLLIEDFFTNKICCDDSKKEWSEFIYRRFVDRVLGCLENEFRAGNAIASKQKYLNVAKIVNDNRVQQALSKGEKYSVKVKILLWPIKKKIIPLCFFEFWIISILKKAFPRLFEYLKYRR